MKMRLASPEDVVALATVHVNVWRETYRGVMPDALLDDLSIAERARMWGERLTAALDSNNPFGVHLIEDAVGLAGFAVAGPQRDAGLESQGYSGEVYAINLLARAQGKGAGRRLMAVMARELAQAGHRSVSLWVAKGNAPASGFYHHLGGTEISTRTVLVLDQPFNEIAIGWLDVGALLEAG